MTLQPPQPVQGTLFRVSVTAAPGDSISAIRATLAGEPLHFHHATGATWNALAALPVDAAGTVHLPLVLSHGDGRTDTLAAAITVARGAYHLEKLTVAPKFGAPPDSATAARIRGEQERAFAISAHSHDEPLLFDGRVVRPRATRITSGYGGGREFNGQVQSRHLGTDFAGAVGAPVRAAARGVVALVASFFLAGNVIYIDHGEGLVSAYFHLSHQDVAVGDTVQPGQVIGRVGATGRVTGPHLHWVVRYGHVSVDPPESARIARYSALADLRARCRTHPRRIEPASRDPAAGIARS